MRRLIALACIAARRAGPSRHGPRARRSSARSSRARRSSSTDASRTCVPEWSDDRRRIDTVVTVAGRVLSERRAREPRDVPRSGRPDRPLQERDDRRAGVPAGRRGRVVPARGRPVDGARLRPEPGRLPRAGRCAKRAAARRPAGADGERRRAPDRQTRGASTGGRCRSMRSPRRCGPRWRRRAAHSEAPGGC